MKYLFVVALLSAIFSPANAELSYHNATPEWLSWGGAYQGTWFHLEDFIPGASDYTVEWAEVWFMSPPDSTVIIEIWNGDQTGPFSLLAQQAYTGSVIWFTSPVEVGSDFWCIVNSEAYSGTAVLLCDGESDGHSYFSDDGIVWEDFNVGEYFISVGNQSESMECFSWARIKYVF